VRSRAGVPPALDALHFVCPHCGVDAQQIWQDADFPARGTGEVDKALMRAQCVLCGGRSYWIAGEMVWPHPTVGLPPPDDLPSDLAALHDEARAVAPISPRAAAALLRLLVDQLIASIGAPDGTLADRIAALAAEGHLPAQVVEGLTACRVHGPEALPPGQIDLHAEDDPGVVLFLCRLVDAIVDTTITLRRHRAELVGDTRRPQPTAPPPVPAD
jgi:Domain of unknown function (DUF4145)